MKNQKTSSPPKPNNKKIFYEIKDHNVQLGTSFSELSLKSLDDTLIDHDINIPKSDNIIKPKIDGMNISK